jgi:hypothetical protein
MLATSSPIQTRLTWAAHFGLLCLLCGWISSINRVSPDLYHEMALAREALAVGYLPAEDVFAYTPTVRPSVHHEWGAGALLYIASVNLGSAGLILLKYGGAVLVGWSCLRLARRRGADDSVATMLAPLALACGCIGFLTVRAQLFTLVFTATLLHLLESDRQGRRWWPFVWLPLYVVWLNMHAGFLVGVGLFALYAIGRCYESWRTERSVLRAVRAQLHLVVIGLAMIGLLPCNPFGWEYAPYLWHAVRMERPFVAEWKPIWCFPRIAALFFVSWLPLMYAARRARVPFFPDCLLVIVPAILALLHVRHLSIYAVVWACYVPAWVSASAVGVFIRQFTARHAAVATAIWLIVAALGLQQAARSRFWELRIPATRSEDLALQYPVGAVRYLSDQSFTGNLMVPFEVGAYVSWKLHPAVKVSSDGRYEVAYPPDQVEELWRFYAVSDNWRSILQHYPSDAILLPSGHRLEQRLASLTNADGTAAWRVVYRDDGFVVYAGALAARDMPAVDRSGQILVADFP